MNQNLDLQNNAPAPDVKAKSRSSQACVIDYQSMSSVERVQKLAELQSLIDAPDQTTERKADLLWEQGNVLRTNRDFEAAIAAYNQALSIRPDSSCTFCRKGSVLDDLGRYEEAIATYDQALAIKPDSCCVLYKKAGTLNDLGRYEEAIATYDQAAAIEPDINLAFFFKGLILINLGRYEEAIATCDQALAIDPNESDVLCNKGNALLNLRRYEEAISSYEQALAIVRDMGDRKQEADFLLVLSGLYNRIGKFSESLKFSNEASRVLLELDLPVDKLPFPQWMKGLIMFHHKGKLQAALTIAGAVVAAPFFLLFLVSKRTLSLLRAGKIRLERSFNV